MGNNLGTKLDANQVIRQAYDETNKRLRVDAEVTASIGTIDVILDPTEDAVSIGDPTGTNFLQPNADGSLNVNITDIAIDQTTDSVAIGDGTALFTSTVVGSDRALDVNPVALAPNAATETTLGSILTELGQKTEPSDAQNIRALSSGTDSVSVPGIATDASLGNILTELQQKTEPSDAQNIRALTSGTDSVSVPGVATETTLGALNTKIPAQGQALSANSIPVVLSSDQPSIPVVLEDEPVKMSGTKNGQPLGTEYTFVNNERLQILDAHDRLATFTYADFGTPTQRITQIDYTSATFPGITVRRQFAYTLVGNRYRRDNETYQII